MIRLIRWLRTRWVSALLYSTDERRGGRERRQCQDRRGEPRFGESAHPRRVHQRREGQSSGC